MKKLAVLIPNYNGGTFIRKAVESFVEGFSESKVIVVDDASTDDSIEQLRSSAVFVIPRDRNGGFAAAVNSGLTQLLKSNVDYVLISNSDVSLTQEVSRKVQVSIDNGFLDPAVAVLGYLEDANTRYLTGADISGFFFVLRLEVVPVVGFFDESFHMYGEEQDFFRRIQEAGYKVYQTGIRISHRGEGSRTSRIRNSWLAIRNSIWLEVKRRAWRRACRKVIVIFLTINKLYRPVGVGDPSLERILRPGVLVGNLLIVAAVVWNIFKLSQNRVYENQSQFRS